MRYNSLLQAEQAMACSYKSAIRVMKKKDATIRQRLPFNTILKNNYFFGIPR